MSKRSNPSKDPIKVCVTGAAGQIGYALLPRIAMGDMFGPDQPIHLNLLDIEPMKETLEGVIMELQDMAAPLLVDVTAYTSPERAFADIDWAILVGAFPRKQGMERADLLAKNADIFVEQGKALANAAKKSVRVVVVGNPANTNAGIACRAAAGAIPKENFSALTRLDHNRATSLLARRTKQAIDDVKGVVIWGNHSGTQVVDASHATVAGSSAYGAVNDDEWLRGEFISTVAKRGAAIIAARKLSSAMSAANAIVDHVRDWALGSNGQRVSMAVVSQGQYGIKEGLVYSYPVVCEGGKYTVVDDLSVDEFIRGKMDVTAKELEEEEEAVEKILSSKL